MAFLFRKSWVHPTCLFLTPQYWTRVGSWAVLWEVVLRLGCAEEKGVPAKRGRLLSRNWGCKDVPQAITL